MGRQSKCGGKENLTGIEKKRKKMEGRDKRCWFRKSLR